MFVRLACAGAANTYNPLGSVLTFLSPDQIAAHVVKVIAA